MRPLTGGLTGVIYQLAFAPDGGALLARDSAHNLGAWDVASGEFRTWPREPLPALSFAVDPVAPRVAVATGSECRFFRWPRGTQQRVAPAHKVPRWGGVQGIALDAARRRVAVAGTGIHVWDTVALTSRGAPNTGSHTAVAFVPGASAVVALDVVSRCAAGWDYATGTKRFRVPVVGAALAVACSPDGAVIAVGSGGGVELLDAAGKRTGRGEIPGTATVTDLAFAPDGRQLLVAAGTPRLTVLDPRTGATTRAFDFGVDKAFAVAIAPDGLTAAVGGMGGRVVTFDLDG